MQIVEALADSNVLDMDGHAVYGLRAGVRYALYDAEAGHGMQSGALAVVAPLDRVLACYERQPLKTQRLILPFIGRLGDAVVAGSCLAALVDRYPDVTVDIAAPALARSVFEIMRPVGRLLPYPIEVDALDAYDFHLSFEDVDAVPRGTVRSCADVFSTCLRTPMPKGSQVMTIPPEAAARWPLPPTDRPRIALHVGRKGNLRTYPTDLMETLVRRLVNEGLCVVLVGSGAGTCGAVNVRTPQVENLIGSTKTPLDLAAVLAQTSALVTGDSFPMHLAGAMGVPTLALFTATDRILGSDYPSVTALQSKASCSPCRIATGSCPLGHAECIAHRDASIDPGVVADQVRSVLTVPTASP